MDTQRTDSDNASNLGVQIPPHGGRRRGVPITAGPQERPETNRRTDEPAVIQGGGVIPGTRGFEKIGIGKPLLIKLESVYLGPDKRGKDVLVTSQVRDPLSVAAGVMSMNMAKYDVSDRAIIDVGVDAGSVVVYYSPAATDDVLNLSVKLKFDGFDVSRVQAVISAAAGVAGLPAFIAGGALAGPVGAASAQALVQAASAGAGLVVSLVDRLVDAKDMVSLDWELNVNNPILPRATAGWVLLHPETKRDSGKPTQWGSGFTSTQSSEPGQVSLTVDGDEFTIGDDGTLRSVDDPTTPYRGEFPYALISVNGHAESKLKKWKPAAVTAGLTARFLQQQTDEKILDQVSDAFGAYSDVLILRDAKTISAEYDAETNTTKRAALKTKLDALITSIQDEDIRKVAERTEA
ncbi:MAG: hypothetical protein JWM50_1704 [Microbacteriaceae bacterium]|jgi:hypothetical protein|nr:hypothetical protein [Microbacteriaceae bacterium]